MKQKTYTLACGKNDVGMKPDSKLEKKFEQFVENKVQRFIQSGKEPMNNRFIKVKIEDHSCLN